MCTIEGQPGDGRVPGVRRARARAGRLAALLLAALLASLAVGSAPTTGPRPVFADGPTSIANFSDFSSVAGLALRGTAQQAGNTLQIVDVNNGSPSAGAAWDTTPIDFTQSFQTHFQVNVHDAPNGQAEGFAFVLQAASSPYAVGDAGGGLGYADLPSGVAVEFDLNQDLNLDDPAAQHVSVIDSPAGQPLSANEGASLDQYLVGSGAGLPPGAPDPLSSLYGAPLDVWMTYSAPGQSLQIWIAPNAASRTLAPQLELPNLNLASHVAATGYVGFTASTGTAAAADTDILNWQFTSGALGTAHQDSTLALAPASATYGGLTTLTATLTTTEFTSTEQVDANGQTVVSSHLITLPVAGRAIAFSIAGQPAGSATTDSAGTAALRDVPVGAVGVGTALDAVTATFAGDPFDYRPPDGTTPLNASAASSTLTVGPAPLTITANDRSMTYGGSVPTFDASYNGLVNDDTSGVVSGLTCGATDASGTPVSSSTPAGSYAITCSGGTAANYAISYQPGTLTINPAALTITANDKSMTYGGSVPSFDARYSGFVAGDSAAALTTAPTCTTTATSSSPVGSYPITCGGAVASNYSISYQPGTLTINPLISLDEQGLPGDVPHQATLDGHTVSLPDSNVEVAYGSSHSYSFPTSVIDSSSGTVYFTSDQGFTGMLTATITDTADYQTMAQAISTALSSGGIDNGGIANSLTQQFATVQADIKAGNTAQALSDVQSFAAHVQAQAGKHLTAATAQALLADAQLVYTNLGGTGAV